MDLQAPINYAMNCYDTNMRNNYNNSIIKTIIMAQVQSLIGDKLNTISNVSYESVMDNDNDYGINVRIETNKLSFKIYAKVHQVIHKNYNDGFITHIENVQHTKMINDCNFTESFTSSPNLNNCGGDQDTTFEPFDATWKLYFNDKKPSIESNPHPTQSFNAQTTKGIKNIFNKLTVSIKPNHDYYAKNTTSMLNYIATVFKSVNKVVDELDCKAGSCDWSRVNLDNFVVANIMLNIQAYLEKKYMNQRGNSNSSNNNINDSIAVVIITQPSCDLIVGGEVELSYDVQENKINVKRVLKDGGKMLINVCDIFWFVQLYFNKKQALGKGFSRICGPKK